MNTDHVIAHDGTGDMPYAMKCLHCGDIQQVALPLQIDLWLAMAAKYVELHANCRPLKERKGKS